MKSKIKTLLALLILPVVIYFFVTGYNFVKENNKVIIPATLSITTSISNPLPKDFVNYILNFHPVDSGSQMGRNLENWLGYYNDSLHYNGIHIYGGYANTISDAGSDKYGRFLPALDSNQKTNTRNLLNNIQSEGLQGFIGRIKIEQLCYAQRIEYEVSNNGDNTTNYGFCYQNTIPGVSVTTDNGRSVLHADVATKNAGYLCDNIYENLQHGDLYGFVQADTGFWYVKPVMRIDPTNYDPNDTTKVVRIDVRNFEGTIIKSVDIKKRNFKIGGTYNGEYLSEYDFSLEPPGTNLEIEGSDTLPNGLNKGIKWGGNYWDWNVNCKIDFKVYWYDSVDVWFDKMIVDDEYGNDLFKGDHDPRIEQEVSNFTNYGAQKFFFVDEIVNSNVACIKYVQDKMNSYSSQYSKNPPAMLSFAVTNGLNIQGMKNDNIAFKMILEKLQPKMVSCDAHELHNFCFPDVFENYDAIVDEYYAGYDTTPSQYNTSLQRLAFGDKNTINSEKPHGSFIYQIEKLRSQITQYSNGTRLIMQPQIHSWVEKYSGQSKYKGIREPMNSEIEAQAMLSIAHGADGLNWFVFSSASGGTAPMPPYGSRNINTSNLFIEGLRYDGLINRSTQSFSKRTSNWYGQNKWNDVANMNQKILNWKPTLDKVIWESGWSVHSEGANHGFVSDIKSYNPNSSGPNPCAEDFISYDCEDERYWEMGFFNPDLTHASNDANDKSKYFIMVNRRCTPQTINYAGDYRGLQVKFNSSQLTGFNNWKIINVTNDSTVLTIDKNSNAYYNFDEFKPGEGRLYKIAPVMQEGGTFVTNESFGGSNLSVNCKDDVYNGGYNLTIAAETEVLFNQGKKIVMEGGSFLCGGVRETWTSEVIGTDVKLKGLTGSTYWDGIEFNNCNMISIGGTRFERIRSNNLYALNVMNCNTLRVRYNLFLSGSNNPQTGSVSFNFIPVGIAREPVIEITGNQFYHNNSDLPSVQIMNYSAGQTSALVRFNEFYGYNSAVGLLMDNVTGGSIKSNIMQNYINSIATSVSYIDLYKNHIVSSADTSEGLSINSGSVANLNFNSNVTYQNSGMNKMINSSSHSHNIVTDNSFFTIKGGFNSLDVINGGTHFFGTFDDYYGSSKQDAEYNCFKIDGSDNVHYTDVDWYSGGEVEFLTDPYVCEAATEDDFDTVVYADGIIDTLWSYIEGMGGGYSNKSESKKQKAETHLTAKMSGSAEFELKQDSLNYYLRKRRFNDVKRIGNELTNSFSDSDRVIDIIQPLYFSTMVTDNENHNGISALKTKLEDLITNNSGNDALVMRCNYFIQKCKVILEDYSSALSGFYDIMQAYPYSWEGIVAGWDYSATQLVSQQGQGGGLNVRGERLEVRSEILEAKQAEISDESAGEFADEPYGDDPKGVKKTIDKTLNDKKEDAVKQIKVEEQQVKEMKIDIKNDKNIKQSKAIQKKLQQKKTMSEIIKPRKPETVIEHINFVNADIQKIYSISGKSTGVEDNISVPQQYSLSQNYPNPFNPITKIKFELPQESKVTIVIYDILGRKVAQLINNELRQPGRYEVQFNGHNFASGIYFYRIVANEFIDTKRMVLVK